MLIEKLYKEKKISVRSYNICMSNDFNSIKDLREYYFEHKTFINLRNCGRRSSEELFDLSIKYNDDDFKDGKDVVEIENPLKTIISNLSHVQREVINSFILVNANCLSVRSRNGISHYLDANFKIKNFAEKILYFDDFDIKNLKNIGHKSVPEIAIYISIIKEYLIKVGKNDDEKYLINLKNSFLIQRLFPDIDVPNEVLESESIFPLIQLVLKKNALFDNTQTIIVKNAFKVFDEQKEVTLDKIADIVDLSRERVRQIRSSCLKEIYSKLIFIQNFNEDLYQKYSIDIDTNNINIDDDTVEIINSKNKTFFSKEFITYVLYVYLNDEFLLVGNIEDVLQRSHFSSRKRHSWNSFYLIKKEIVQVFNFTAFVNDIYIRINRKINKSYSFNFKSYLSRFLNNNKIDLLDAIFPMAEKIINKEFDLYLNLHEELIFERTTFKSAYEYAYEALELLNKPSSIKEINKTVSEIHPNYDTSEAKIRAAMQRKRGFVPVGRKSVFGLKKWEEKRDDFKGGTIRDIVEEYLNQFLKPKHISDITKHVLRYRPKSNQYSIFQNLKFDRSGRFVFFEGSIIGLPAKKYSNKYVEINELNRLLINSWKGRFEALQDFINKEKRLPFSTGSSKSEKNLYQWFYKQRGKYSNNELEEEQEKLIIEIVNKYSHLSSRIKLNTFEKYEELINFIEVNLRLPSASRKGEKSLCSFFYKRRNLFEQNKLDAREKIEFAKVIRIIQNIKE